MKIKWDKDLPSGKSQLFLHIMTLSCQPWQPINTQQEYCLSFPAVSLHGCHSQICSMVLYTCFILFIVVALKRSQPLWEDNSQLSPEKKKWGKQALVAKHHHPNLLGAPLCTHSLKWSAKIFSSGLVKLHMERMDNLLLKCQRPWWLTDVICCSTLVPEKFGTVGA